VGSSNALYLVIGTILFVGLFSFMVLPKPLEPVREIFQSASTFLYKLIRLTGGVTDSNMCTLADLWNMAGIDAEVLLEVGGQENFTCAVLTEEKIAMIPQEKEIFGDELQGVVTDVYLIDWTTVHKLFYVSYIIMGLAFAAVITDILLNSGLIRTTAATALGYFIIVGVAVTLLMFRSGAMWAILSAFLTIVPGNSLLAEGIFLMLSMSALWWLVSQVMLGYHIAQQSHKKFAAIRLAGRADYERGMRAMGEKRSK